MEVIATDYRQAFHEAYCARQRLSPKEGCTVPHEQLRLLHETAGMGIVLNEGWEDVWLNVVDKKTRNGQREMESIEP